MRESLNHSISFSTYWASFRNFYWTVLWKQCHT